MNLKIRETRFGPIPLGLLRGGSESAAQEGSRRHPPSAGAILVPVPSIKHQEASRVPKPVAMSLEMLVPCS